MFDKQQYLDNEDNNYHTENGIALANEFGTPEEQKLMAQIQKDHYARGHINPDEIEARNAIVKKYYPMLEGLDEGTKGCADCEWIKDETDGDITTCDDCAAEKRQTNEAGGYYTQPVYDMIKKHGYEKVMHELLTSLHADVIQDFISRADFDESVSETLSPKEKKLVAKMYNKDGTLTDLGKKVMGEGNEDTKDNLLGDLKSGLEDAKAGNSMSDFIADEIGDYIRSGIENMGAEAWQDSIEGQALAELDPVDTPEEQAKSFQNAINMLKGRVEEHDAKGLRKILSKLPYVGDEIHGHDHMPVRAKRYPIVNHPKKSRPTGPQEESTSGLRSAVRETEKRWKQTSISPAEAIAKYGKENVKVKKGGLRNGDDMVQVFVENNKSSRPDKPSLPPKRMMPMGIPDDNDAPQPNPPSDTPPNPTTPKGSGSTRPQPNPEPKQPKEPKQPQQPSRQKYKKTPKAIYASKHAGKLKEKIFRAATENEKQINELDLYAPNTDYIRAPNGEYFKVDYRNTGTITGGGHKRADLTAFKNVVKADPKEVDVLGLDSRLDYADRDGSGVKSKKSNEIHVGHEIQGGSPFSDKDISVYDMDSEDYHNNVPDGAKAAVIKFMTQQKDESAKSERRLRIADWIQTRK